MNTLSSGNTVLTLTPPALLQGSTLYSILIAGVKDMAGNTLTPTVTRTFTTAPGADVGYPTVAGVNPPNFYQGAATNIRPTLVFSKTMNPISLNTSTVLMLDTSTGQYLNAAIQLSSDRTSVTLQPPANLKTNTQYKFSVVGVTDLGGNAVYGDWYFTTGLGPDNTPPTITAMSPPNGSQVPINVKLQFSTSKPISPLTFNGATAVVLTSGVTGIAGAATLSFDLQTITFTPKNNLTSTTNYSVNVSGFKDLAGNTVTPFPCHIPPPTTPE